MRMFSDCPDGLPEKLSGVSVGIAGAGGIGSNVAMLLARSGASKIRVADFDVVEPTNLNRQFFFADQVGMPKVEALRENVLRINCELSFEAVQTRLTADNVHDVFRSCDVLVEAVDLDETKAMLIEQWISLFPHRPIIACSGIAGAEDFQGITVARTGKLSVVGDQHSDLSLGTFSAKVMAVASAMVMELYHRIAGGRCAECGGCTGGGIVLKTAGKQVPLTGFPARMMEEVIRGMLKTLKGADPQGAISLEIGHTRS